jgi:hypothetical protein
VPTVGPLSGCHCNHRDRVHSVRLAARASAAKEEDGLAACAGTAAAKPSIVSNGRDCPDALPIRGAAAASGFLPCRTGARLDANGCAASRPCARRLCLPGTGFFGGLGDTPVLSGVLVSRIAGQGLHHGSSPPVRMSPAGTGKWASANGRWPVLSICHPMDASRHMAGTTWRPISRILRCPEPSPLAAKTTYKLIR